MNEEWNSVNYTAPKDGEPVLCSVKLGISFYNEVLSFDYKTREWSYNNGNKLEKERHVVGWKSVGSTYLG
jgi:hypothetical protein